MTSAGARARATRKAIARFENAPVDYDPKALDDPREIRLLALADLVIDENVQRGTTRERIQQMANEWDWRLAEVPTVVPIGDGRYRAKEGQNRILAARLRAPAGHIWCVINPQCDVRSEVDVGLRISTSRKPHNAYDKWTARLRRGDPHEVCATTVLTAHGLRVGATNSGNTIAGVAAVSKIIHGRKAPPEVGAELLDNLLRVMLAAWPEQDTESRISRFDHRLLEAIAEIIRRNPNIDLRRLATKLRGKAAARWISDVTESRNRTAMIANAVIASYNRQLRAKGQLKWQ